MIYFSPALQKRVVEMFHYGLRREGLLYLGTSEALTAHGGFFEPIPKKQRLFKRLDVPTQRLASPPGGYSRTARAKDRLDLSEKAMEGRIAQVLTQFTPAYMIIDQYQNVLHFSGPISKYLAPAKGPATLLLANLVNPSLRAPLQTALKEVKSTQSRVVAPAVVFQVDGHAMEVNLVIEPLRAYDKEGSAMLVAFQAPRETSVPSGVLRSTEDFADEEMSVAQKRFQAITQELETANEELQSANEEYQSVNEESGFRKRDVEVPEMNG
jgi:two-component system CheB/CheR fusion protein